MSWLLRRRLRKEQEAEEAARAAAARARAAQEEAEARKKQEEQKRIEIENRRKVPKSVEAKLLELARACEAEMRQKGCNRTDFESFKRGERCYGGIWNGYFTINISYYDSMAEGYTDCLLDYNVRLSAGEVTRNYFKANHGDGYCATTMSEILSGCDKPSTPMAETELAGIIAEHMPQIRKQLREKMHYVAPYALPAKPKNGGLSDIKW